MNNLHKSLFILCALLMGLCMPSSLLGQSQPSLLGEGTESNPFRISSSADWDAFANDVSNGISYSDKYVLLTNDITVTTMAGDPTNNKGFEGRSFDGNGHTMTVNLSGDEEYIAPFRWVKTSETAFKNLKVAGTITTTQKYAGGIIGKVNGQNATIAFENCHVAVTINSNVYGEGSHGGFMGSHSGNRDIYFTNCLFSGSLLGEYTNGCAGFVGWNESNYTVCVYNCFFDPATITVATYDSHPFARATENPFDYCYYSGFKSTALGNPTNPLNNWSATSYEDILSVLNTSDPSHNITGNGWEMQNGHPVPKMVKALNGSGSSDDPYLIASSFDWNLFCDLLQTTDFNGKLINLTNDISVTRMAGDSDHPFKGTFDGKGHTLTVNYTTYQPYAAPFRRTEGATFRLLKVTGTINTSGTYAGGLIGWLSSGIQINNCHVAVTINSSFNGTAGHGGLVGKMSSGCTINDCLFSGSMTGALTGGCGGFVGELVDGSITFTNCLFDPTALTLNNNDNWTLVRCINNSSYLFPYGQSGYKTAFGTANTGLQDWTNTDYTTILSNLGNKWKMENGKVVPKLINEEFGALITYLDLDGNPQTVQADPIPTSDYIGEPGKTCWYYVSGAVSISNSYRIKAAGHANVILCDGCQLTNASGINVNAGQSLTIWAQSVGTGQGQWTIASTAENNAGMGCGTYGETFDDNTGNITINGGRIYVVGGSGAPAIGGGSGNSGVITINRGVVNATSTGDNTISSSSSINFNGGQLTVNHNMNAPHVNLSWTNTSDFIQSSYAGTVTLLKDFTEYNGTGAYHAGVVNHSLIDGKKLVPHEHGVYTHHDAVTPTFNPSTGEYTDGYIEHYTCSCGRYYLLDNTTYIEVTENDVLRPYFLIKKNSSNVVGIFNYYGTDAEVTIPNTVPEHYATGNLTVSDAINTIGQQAFLGNTTVEEITLGDNINHLGYEAFYGCTSLVKFTCSASEESFTVDPYPFDHSAATVFYGMHEGSFRTAYNSTNFATGSSPAYTYIGLDRHDEPTWTWSEDFTTATATFNCSRCDYAETLEATITTESLLGRGYIYTATVTDDGGNTYSDAKTIMDYLDLDGTTKYQEVTILQRSNSAEIIESGWYAMNGFTSTVPGYNPTHDPILPHTGRYIINGDVNIILCDGHTLRNDAGTTVSPNASLTIWGQSEGTGQWIINPADPEHPDDPTISSVYLYNAGMGGQGEEYSYEYANSGTITINGGNIQTRGGWYGAGIGGGNLGNGTVIINGGTINAQGGYNKAAGIGGGQEGNGTVTINGGNVEAQGGYNGGAGIGGGFNGRCTVTIHGGTIEAQGGKGYPGIGGTRSIDSEEAMVTINDGTVTATGGMEASGIGGCQGAAGTITINGGDVTAIGGVEDEQNPNGGGAGIGSGRSAVRGIPLQVTISGGKVTATGRDGGCGIGGGYHSVTESSSILIAGGNVTATAEEHADAVGIGVVDYLSNVTIDCNIGLTYLDATNCKIYGSSYAGHVTLGKSFVTNEGNTLYGIITDYTTINGKTLTPAGYRYFVTDGNWNVDDNWSPSGVPTATENVVITAANTITDLAQVNKVTIGDGGSLTIEDGGQLIHNNEGVVATVKKNIVGHGDGLSGGWNFIATPMVSTEINTNIISGNYDLYMFDQTRELEWQNYKKNGTDNHTDFTTLENGNGYLYANETGIDILFTGTLANPTSGVFPLAYQTTNPNDKMHGWNLVGNPYPCNTTISQSFYVIGGTHVVANTGGSTVIPPCTGVMVKATESGQSVTFTKTTQSASQGRNLQIMLSQVPELVEGPANCEVGVSTGSTTLVDNAIVSFTEGDELEKFIFNEDNAKVCIPQGGKDYAIAFSEGQGEMPLNFKAKENGSYTLTVNPEGVEMVYLHLIDNMTGADVDLLQTQNYTFNANVTDYESRFKLVFAVNDGLSTGSGAFAFISNGNIIVNGEGMLQVIDMTGRIVCCKDVARNVSTMGMTPGVYVLRLIQGDDVKTQKIIIK